MKKTNRPLVMAMPCLFSPSLSGSETGNFGKNLHTRAPSFLAYRLDKWMILAISFLPLVFALPAFSQSTMGKVKDSDGDPIAAALIQIKAINYRTVADVSGSFALKVPAGKHELTISSVGFEPARLNVTIPSKDPIIVRLATARNNLNEVQIIGYGETTKRLSTGSIASVSAKDIEKQPVSNVLSALSGRMPGVFIQTTSGLPGGNVNIQIRGRGSIAAGTNPLYIIDGVPFDGSAPNRNGNLQVNNYIGGTVSPLNTLNPSDIETIDVLKDADATSIYGSRGANGVILIATKKAKTGKTRLDVNLQQGVSVIAQKPRLLSSEEYFTVRREAFANTNRTPSIDPASVNYAPDLLLWDQSVNTDWTQYLFGNTAQATDLQAKISGGEQGTTFSVSGNYRNETTVLPGENNFRRAGIYAQLQYSSEDKRFNLSFTYQFSHQLNALSNPKGSIETGFLLAPNYPLYLPDGSYNWYAYFNVDAEGNARSSTTTQNMISNLSLNYRLLEGLNLRLSTGYTNTAYDQVLTFPTRSLYPGTTNFTDLGKNSSGALIIEPQVDYRLSFGSSSLKLMAGATYQDRQADRELIQASNFSLEALMEDLSSAGTIDLRQSAYSRYKFASIFARATYNLKESLVLNGTLRRDGSSRFGPGSRFGNFAAIGGAWIFGSNPLVKRVMPWLSHGKLRASYGSSGNDQISDYGYLSTYSSPGSAVYQDMATIRPSRISNDSYHWETTYKTDLALELGFLKDRISLTAEYFYNTTKDQLVQYSIPQVTGFSGYKANLPAVIVNKGLELSLNGAIIKGDKLNWSTTLNLTLPSNKLASFENFSSSSYAMQYELGYDLTRFTGYRFLGVDPNTGAAQYAGEDGKPSSNPYYNFTLGKQTPDFYGGLENVIGLGNLELSIFMQFVKQVGLGGLRSSPGITIANQYAIAADRWSPSNPTGSYPKASLVSDGYLGNSSLNIFDTSYLRIKNISLSYSFPAAVTRRLRIQNLRIYSQLQNAFTYWNRNAAVLDPESGVSLDPFTGSRNFPSLRTIILGLQVSL